jgi:DnaJ-class molecular chaperone
VNPHQTMDEDKKQKSKIHAHKDYYAVLKLRGDATAEQIAEAYYSLYEKFGPSVDIESLPPEEAEQIMKGFQDIQDAYEILGDGRRREEYDRAAERRRQQSGDVRALWSKVSGNVPPMGGGAEGDSKQPKIQALAYEVQAEVSLKEAIKGTRFSFTIGDPTPCEDCAGLKPVNRMQCQTCRGLGYFNANREEEVVLPPNMYDGMEIRKPELGRYDLRACRNGDLIIKIKVKEHPHLTIIGNDLQCTVPVLLYEAVLGAEIEVPTATGKVVMKIQPLSQPGRIYRLKGLGLGGGDQLVKIEVLIPQKISGEEIALFKKLKEMCKDPNPRRDFFAK